MSIRREAPAAEGISSTEARLQTLEARTMIHSDSLSRLWSRVGSKMRVETAVPVYVEPATPPMSDRMRKVLETGCAAMGPNGPTDAPCAVVVMYGSMRNQIYYYTNKPPYRFGELEVTDMTNTMMRNHDDFYGHMTDTTGYLNVYTYSHDGKMGIDQILGKMYASKFTGTYGDNWYSDMTKYGEERGDPAYPYITKKDTMMRIKMNG